MIPCIKTYIVWEKVFDSYSYNQINYEKIGNTKDEINKCVKDCGKNFFVMESDNQCLN